MKNNIMVKNNWDDDRLQVVMIIYGNYPNNGRNRNGETDYISSLKDTPQFYHYLYYIKHAENNYNNDLQYQLAIKQLMFKEEKEKFYPTNLLFLNTNKYNNIVFDNVYDNIEDETYGLLSLPPTEPTPEQYEALNNLLIKLNEVGYEQIFIQGGLNSNSQDILHADISLIISGKDILSIPGIIQNKYNKLSKKRRR